MCDYAKDYSIAKYSHKLKHNIYVSGPIVDYLFEKFPDKTFSSEFIELDEESKIQLIKGIIDASSNAFSNLAQYVIWGLDEPSIDVLSALLTTMGIKNHKGDMNLPASIVFTLGDDSVELCTTRECSYKKYNGKVYCLETETGAFVVRRDGKPFISGNSGFPKSLNIGLAIDKKNGVEDNIVDNKNETMKDFRDVGQKQKEISGNNKLSFGQVENSKQKQQPIYKIQNEWEGWGSCLKPAYEPIIVARKPLDGSLVDNVIQYGVGGLNIDACRVPISQEDINTINAKSSKNPTDNYNYNEAKKYGNYKLNIATSANSDGRFPANVILTYDEEDKEEVCGGFPDSKGSSSQNVYTNSSKYGGNALLPSSTKRYNYQIGYNDDGSASRYFYCAKASKKDRDEGLGDSFKEQLCSMMASNANINESGEFTGLLAGRKTSRKNIHPTVKPTELMQYLVRLVTPPGGIILDPFMGSGSTGKAVMYENNERHSNYKFYGIELSPEYIDIAEARITYATNDLRDYELHKETGEVVTVPKSKPFSLFDIFDDLEENT